MSNFQRLQVPVSRNRIARFVPRAWWLLVATSVLAAAAPVGALAQANACSAKDIITHPKHLVFYLDSSSSLNRADAMTVIGRYIAKLTDGQNAIIRPTDTFDLVAFAENPYSVKNIQAGEVVQKLRVASQSIQHGVGRDRSVFVPVLENLKTSYAQDWDTPTIYLFVSDFLSSVNGKGNRCAETQGLRTLVGEIQESAKSHPTAIRAIFPLVPKNTGRGCSIRADLKPILEDNLLDQEAEIGPRITDVLCRSLSLQVKLQPTLERSGNGSGYSPAVTVTNLATVPIQLISYDWQTPSGAKSTHSVGVTIRPDDSKLIPLAPELRQGATSAGALLTMHQVPLPSNGDPTLRWEPTPTSSVQLLKVYQEVIGQGRAARKNLVFQVRNDNKFPANVRAFAPGGQSSHPWETHFTVPEAATVDQPVTIWPSDATEFCVESNLGSGSVCVDAPESIELLSDAVIVPRFGRFSTRVWAPFRRSGNGKQRLEAEPWISVPSLKIEAPCQPAETKLDSKLDECVVDISWQPTSKNGGADQVRLSLIRSDGVEMSSTAPTAARRKQPTMPVFFAILFLLALYFAFTRARGAKETLDAAKQANEWLKLLGVPGTGIVGIVATLATSFSNKMRAAGSGGILDSISFKTVSLAILVSLVVLTAFVALRAWRVFLVFHLREPSLTKNGQRPEAAGTSMAVLTAVVAVCLVCAVALWGWWQLDAFGGVDDRPAGQTPKPVPENLEAPQRPINESSHSSGANAP